MSLLEVTNLKVNYGGIEALKGISFTVNEGEIVTLIGANGAGKSTTVRAISSIVPAAGGSIVYNGVDITKADAQKVVEAGVVMVPEGRKVIPHERMIRKGYKIAVGALLYTEGDMQVQAAHPSMRSTLMKASLGSSTEPTCRMRFLPSFCFSKSFFFRVISPP